YSILPVLGLDGYLSFNIFEGSVTAEKFEKFLCEHVPLMHPYPGPQSVLILDNCSIHHGPLSKHLLRTRLVKYQIHSLFEYC
ncbi:hypothetical protein BS47DRAFT_1302046, partial [Hydnum rufescens UP504]